MSWREKAAAILASASTVYLVSGLILALHYYLRHIANPHRDMFGVKGAFVVGGLFSLALCLGSVGVTAVLVLKKRDAFRRAVVYSIVSGLISGVLASSAIIKLDPEFRFPLVVLAALVLSAIPVLARVLLPRST